MVNCYTCCLHVLSLLRNIWIDIQKGINKTAPCCLQVDWIDAADWVSRQLVHAKQYEGTGRHCLNIESHRGIVNYWSSCGRFIVKGKKKSPSYVCRTGWLSRSTFRTRPRNPLKTSRPHRFRPSAFSLLFPSPISPSRVCNFCETFWLLFPSRPAFRPYTITIPNLNQFAYRKASLLLLKIHTIDNWNELRII